MRAWVQADGVPLCAFDRVSFFCWIRLCLPQAGCPGEELNPCPYKERYRLLCPGRGLSRTSENAPISRPKVPGPPERIAPRCMARREARRHAGVLQFACYGCCSVTENNRSDCTLITSAASSCARRNSHRLRLVEPETVHGTRDIEVAAGVEDIGPLAPGIGGILHRELGGKGGAPRHLGWIGCRPKGRHWLPSGR